MDLGLWLDQPTVLGRSPLGRMLARYRQADLLLGDFQRVRVRRIGEHHHVLTLYVGDPAQFDASQFETEHCGDLPDLWELLAQVAGVSDLNPFGAWEGIGTWQEVQE